VVATTRGACYEMFWIVFRVARMLAFFVLLDSNCNSELEDVLSFGFGMGVGEGGRGV
jgi:hypothetical protein